MQLRVTIICAALGCALAAELAAQNINIFSVQDGGESALNGNVIFNDMVGAPATTLSVNGGTDDVDGFSDNTSLNEFLFCFSVDDQTAGTAPPPTGYQFNVLTEGTSGASQAAGDAFLSTESFDRVQSTGGLGASNNVLVVNQSQPTSPPIVDFFGLLPNRDPAVSGPPPINSDLDNVDGGSGLPVDGVFYFSLATESEGATIFFEPDAFAAIAGDEKLFAAPLQLGLAVDDDINAMVVFDDNGDGLFNQSDQILFSLDRGSPTLGPLGLSAADILTVAALPADFNRDGMVDGTDTSIQLANFGIMAGATPAMGDADGDGDIDAEDVRILSDSLGARVATDLHTAGDGIGLDRSTDNLNMLAVAPLMGGSVATTLSFALGEIDDADFDLNGAVDGDDFLTWQANFGLAVGATRADGDADRDGDVDGDDFLIWQGEYSLGAGAAQAIPEPATAALWTLGAVVLAGVRRAV